MTNIIINERTRKGKMLMEIIQKFEDEGIVYIQKKPNTETQKAIEEVKSGKVTKCDSVDDLMKKLKL